MKRHDSLGVSEMRGSKAAQTALELRESGWRIYKLADTIRSKDDFFDAVRAELPLDPPLESNRSWDALSDSLWSGIDAYTDERVVIYWPKTSRIGAVSPETFNIAKEIFSEVAETLADDETTAGSEKQLVVLLGD